MAQPPPRSTRPSQAASGKPAGVSRSPDVERAMMLRDVMDHAVRVQKEITAPTSVNTGNARRITLAAVCAGLMAFSVYSWVARPEFIWGRAAQPLPPPRQNANVRFALYLLSQRIEFYRAAQGAYPASLGVIGEALPGVTFHVVSDSIFELRAMQDGKPIVFRSDESVDVFLGNSPLLIQAPPR